MNGSTRFVGAALAPGPGYVDSPALSQGEPPLPASFGWGAEELPVLDVINVWRSTKVDRGDAYLAKLGGPVGGSIPSRPKPEAHELTDAR